MKSCLYPVLFAAVMAAPLSAGSFSFQGVFSTDDQVQLFDIMLLSGRTVTFQSYGYGGGTNQAGTVISPGGFDSRFTWFDTDDSQIGQDDDGCGLAGSNHGACLDAFASVFLTAGHHVLALTESGNDSNGDLSQGFSQQGNGDFTANGTCTAFCDSLGNTDNGHWAVDILNVDSAAPSGTAPEPTTSLLVAAGLALLIPAYRRKCVLQNQFRS